MPPLRKAPGYMASGLRKPSAFRPVYRPLSSPTPSEYSSYNDEPESAKHQHIKLVVATATTVLLLLAMAANCYMAVTSQTVFSDPPWDRTASLMFASFGELACSMTLIPVLATINPEFLWGVLSGLVGIAVFVLVALLHGVGGPATAVFLGFSIFWTAFVAELKLKWCPVVTQWLTVKFGWDPAACYGSGVGSGLSPLELPISDPFDGGRHRSTSASSFDDCETLYSPTTPSSDDYVINMTDKLGIISEK